ncbi:MAG TPA: hypothetical protein VN743_02245 [Blastocatellia bacterium]|nr:hypothetical protein [Blastocatellia bacterium]
MLNTIKQVRAIVLMLSLASSAIAQQPEKKFRLDAFDKAWIATIIGDRVSTEIALNRCPACSEQGPIKNRWATMTIQFGALAATKWMEHKYPEHSTFARVFKGVVITVGAAVIVHNLNQKSGDKSPHSK